MRRILLLEDDTMIASGILYALDPKENSGYKVKSDPEADRNEKQNGLCIDVY